MTRVLAAIALLLAGSLGPLASLGPLIESGLWLPSVLAAVGAATAVLLVLRLATRWVVWPTIIAALAGLLVALVVESRGAESLPGPDVHPLPGIGRILLEGAATLRTGVAPISEGGGVALIVATVVVLLFVAAEALAVGADSPALAGAPLLLLWAPQVVMGTDVPIGYPLLSAASYILLLTVAGSARSGIRQVAPAAAGVTALTIVCSLIVTPWALSAPSWLGGLGSGSTTRLDLGLDIRSDLVRGDDSPLISYQGLSPSELGPVHSHTLADFDGQRWHPGGQEVWMETSLLYPEGTGAMVNDDAEAQSVTFVISHLGQERLLLPEAPRQLTEPTRYDPFRDEVYSPAGTSVTYNLSGPPLISDPDVWNEQSRANHAPTDVDEYLRVPETSKREEIEELTRQITEGASTPYEKAVAIQDFFRSDDRFEYTTSVPQGDSDDAVWDFLEHGQGYCVQFATAMVVLARTAGIPARMAVGFLPGQDASTADGQSGGVISSHDAHTWPQLFLGAAGWARFEPTPASRTGPVPGHARGLPAQTETQAPEEIPTGAPAPQEEPTAEPEQPTIAPAPAPEQEQSGPWWPPVVLALAIVLGAGAWWAARRRGEPDPRQSEPEEHWQEAMRVLRSRGLRPEPGDTPSKILGKAEDLLLTEGQDALSHLTAAVNTARYSKRPGAVRREELDQWLAQVKEGLVTN